MLTQSWKSQSRRFWVSTKETNFPVSLTQYSLTNAVLTSWVNNKIKKLSKILWKRKDFFCIFHRCDESMHKFPLSYSLFAICIIYWKPIWFLSSHFIGFGNILDAFWHLKCMNNTFSQLTKKICETKKMGWKKKKGASIFFSLIRYKIIKQFTASS